MWQQTPVSARPRSLCRCTCLGCCCRVKAGGPDPVANSKLSDLLKQAKDLGVPKDIIERNIKKASDAKQGDFQECM